MQTFIVGSPESNPAFLFSENNSWRQMRCEADQRVAAINSGAMIFPKNLALHSFRTFAIQISSISVAGVAPGLSFSDMAEGNSFYIQKFTI